MFTLSILLKCNVSSCSSYMEGKKEFVDIQSSEQGNQRYLMGTKLCKFWSNSGNSRNS